MNKELQKLGFVVLGREKNILTYNKKIVWTTLDGTAEFEKKVNRLFCVINPSNHYVRKYVVGSPFNT